MAFMDPLDKLPQVPQAWANHIVLGGVVGAGFSLFANWMDFPDSLEFGAAATLIIATVKKAVDYAETDETAAECIGKAFATAAWPASIALMASLGNA